MKNQKEYTKLAKLITSDFKARRDDFIASLRSYTTTTEIMSHWRYKDLITPSKKKLDWTETGLKVYLIERYDLKQGKEIEKKLSELAYTLNSGELNSIKVSVEWKRSATWGSNPKAEAWARFKMMDSEYNDSNYVESGSIGGCGYDKLSTAVAEVLNQVPQLKRALYLLKAKKPNVTNHDLFGYGSGYGKLPSFEGGVGVSCYPAIFKAIGFEFRTVASGKTFDVFEITKLKN